MTKSDAIKDIYFSNRRFPKRGVEVLTLESLFQRKIDQVLQLPHRVHFYHILLFTQGTGSHIIDFNKFDYDPETILIVSKGQVQQFHVNPANTGFVIIFTSDYIYENITELDLFHSLRVFEQALFAPSIHLTTEHKIQLLSLVQTMQTEYQASPDELSNEIQRHLLRLLLLEIERIQSTSVVNQPVLRHYQDFVAFRRLLERDLGKSRSVHYYASQLAISPKRLNELTRQVLNKSAKDFIEEQVVLESKRMLAQGDIPIKEIAYQLGFNDPTNLVKFFKKHTQTSPAAFRKQFIPSA